MDAVTWTSELGARIFTIVKTSLIDNGIMERYPTLQFVSPDKQYIPSDFPTVWIREIQSIEMGNDLDNTTINAVSENIQVDVISRERQISRKIMCEVVVEFKKLRFNVNALPLSREDDLKAYCFARFNRTIGYNDALITGNT